MYWGKMANRRDIKLVLLLALTATLTALTVALGTQKHHSSQVESRILQTSQSDSIRTNQPDPNQSKLSRSEPSEPETSQVKLSQSKPDVTDSLTTTRHSTLSVHNLEKQLKGQEKEYVENKKDDTDEKDEASGYGSTTETDVENEEEIEERVETNPQQNSSERETTTNGYNNDEVSENGATNKNLESKIPKQQTPFQEKENATSSESGSLDNKSKNITTDEWDEEVNGEDVDEEELRREHKLVSNGESFTASLLMDIRDALYDQKESEQKRESEESMERRLTHLEADTEDSIRSMATNFDTLRQNMDQKVSLMMETFSTLKLLVLSQGEQLRPVLERLHRVEDQAENFEENIEGIHRSLDSIKTTLNTSRSHKNRVSPYVNDNTIEEDDTFDLRVNVTEIGERIEDNTSSLENLTSQVKEMKRAIQTIKEELQYIPANISDLATMTSSPPPPPESSTGTDETPVDSTSCQCLDNELKSSIRRIEEVQEQQKKEIDELRRNLTTVEREEEAEGHNDKWNYSHRLGEAEGTLVNMNEVKNTISSMQDDLLNLKEKLGSNTHFSTSPTSLGNTTEGVCVWPYKRGGGSCFHVHTEDRLTWEGARDYCRDIQGDLAAPQHYHNFKKFILKQRLSRAYTYWMGATSSAEGGVWAWLDGREVSEEVWGTTSQPEQDRGKQCMALKPVYKFVASAESCRESRFFICQQERLL